MAYQGKKHHLLNRIQRICLTSPSNARREFGKTGLALGLLLFVAVLAWAKMPAQHFEAIVTATEEIDLPPVVAEAGAALAFAAADPKPVLVTQPGPTPAPAPFITAGTGQRQTKADTVPVPAIPQMKTTPALTPFPDFSAAAEKLEKGIKAGTLSRTALQGEIRDMREKLNQWKSRLREEYFSPWKAQREAVKRVYEDYKSKIDLESGEQDMAALTSFQRGTQKFEAAFQEYEEAIRTVEDEVNEGVEDVLKEVEDVIRTQEEKQQDHEERMAFHGDRMEVHGFRMEVHGTRMEIHGMRMEMHGNRMEMHGDRMKAHGVVMEKFREAVTAELLKDGFIKSKDDPFELIIKNDKITINGQALDAQQTAKYRQLIESFGFEIKNDQKEWGIKISERGTSIGHFNKSE